MKTRMLAEGPSPGRGQGCICSMKHTEKKILPVTGRKIRPGRCWDCVDLANVCFGQDQVEEKGQHICQGYNRCQGRGQPNLGAMLKVTVFITAGEFHPDEIEMKDRGERSAWHNDLCAGETDPYGLGQRSPGRSQAVWRRDLQPSRAPEIGHRGSWRGRPAAPPLWFPAGIAPALPRSPRPCPAPGPVPRTGG